MSKEMRNVLDAYNSISKEYKANIKSHDLDEMYTKRFYNLFKPGKQVLDVGTGTGDAAGKMAKHYGLDVVAIDISQDMLELAQKSHPDIGFMNMDARNLEFGEGVFDGVFANYSLIHIKKSDIPQTLQGFSKILKKEGYLYLALQEPLTLADKDGYYSVPYKKDIKMYISLFTREEIRNYLDEAGFSILNMQGRNPEPSTEFPFKKLFVIAQKM